MIDKEERLTVTEKRIRLLRNIHDITQKELALALGVSKGLINSWENGLSNISLKQLVKLAYYFKVPMDYILGLTTDYNISDYNFRKELNIELLGKRIKLIRKLEGLNQTKFASLINTKIVSVSNYENAKNIITSSGLKDLCNTFGYSVDWVCGNTIKCIRRSPKIKIKEEEIMQFIAN